MLRKYLLLCLRKVVCIIKLIRMTYEKGEKDIEY